MQEQNKTKKIFQRLVWVLLFIYLLILARVILFKYPFHITLEALENNSLELFKRRLDLANFVPFKTIKFYLSDSRVGLNIRAVNLLANIISFMPLGFMLPFIKKRLNNYLKIFGLSLVLSLFFEIVQLASGIGSFDIDDIILNTFGAMLGYVIYKTVIKITRFFI